VLAKGAQQISREWFDLMRERLAKNAEAMNRLAGCRSVQDVVAVQSEIVRDGLGQAVNGSRRFRPPFAVGATDCRGVDPGRGRSGSHHSISSKAKRERSSRSGVALRAENTGSGASRAKRRAVSESWFKKRPVIRSVQNPQSR
jgi:Phasin protein